MNQKVLQAAQNYSKSKGMNISLSPHQVNINPEHGAQIANAYENMKHNPNHPDVKAAYGALINETGEQFKHLMNSGLKISKIKPGTGKPVQEL